MNVFRRMHRLMRAYARLVQRKKPDELVILMHILPPHALARLLLDQAQSEFQDIKRDVERVLSHKQNT